MNTLLRYWLEIERRMHMVDAYLASCRGDGLLVADCESRAYECERMIATLELQS